jgi:NitT/TauT family transport system ATP-binding protein
VGAVRVMGRPVGGIDPRIGFVFQADAVFPWRNVLDNVAAGPLFAALARRRLRLAETGSGRWAWANSRTTIRTNSGGMRKRVALAQTFINQPQILLMDEPFSALDMQTRTLMQDELLQLWSQTAGSVVFVTHDLEEAIAMADRVLVLTARPATLKRVYKSTCRARATSEVRYDSISSNCPSASGRPARRGSH